SGHEASSAAGNAPSAKQAAKIQNLSFFPVNKPISPISRKAVKTPRDFAPWRLCARITGIYLLDLLDQRLPCRLALRVGGGVVEGEDFIRRAGTQGLPEIPLAELAIGVGGDAEFEFRIGEHAPLVGAAAVGPAMEILAAGPDESSARQLDAEIGHAQGLGGLHAGFAQGPLPGDKGPVIVLKSS